jgi:chromate reductase
MAQPEAYVGNTGSLFDGAGQIANDSTQEFLAAFGKAFIVRNR